MTASGPGSPVPAGPTAAPTAVPERTVLSWQRTALALVAGAAVLSRVTADELGTASLLGLALTMPLALGVLVAGSRRGRPGDGRPAAALCAGTVVLGVLQLAAVLLGDGGR